MNPRMKEFVSIVLVLVFVISAALTTPASAQSGATGDLAKLSSETIPDGTVLNPNQQFTKCWTVLNAGDTVWNTSYTLNFVSGEQMSAPTTTIKIASNVDRKNTIQICTNFVAPTAAGRYKSVWQMKNALGQLFDHQIYAEIVVQNQGNNVTYQVSASSTPQPKNFDFKQVSSSEIQIYYNGEWVSATPGPYYTIRSDTAEFKVFYYNSCTTKYYVEDWKLKSKQECVKQYRTMSDASLGAAVSFSEEGTLQFYSYMRGLTFGMVGNVGAGTLTGINGYKIYQIGSAASGKLAAISQAGARVTPFVMIVSFIVYAEKIWIVTYPIQPIPAQIAPASYTALNAMITSQELRLAHSAKVVDGKTEGDMTDEVTKTTARWVVIVKNGMCWGSIHTEHLRTDENGNPKFITIDQDLNENQPGRIFSCEEWDIFLMFVRWAQQAAYKLLTKAEFYFVLQRLFDRFVTDLKLTTLNYGDLWAMLRGVLFGE